MSDAGAAVRTVVEGTVTKSAAHVSQAAATINLEADVVRNPEKDSPSWVSTDQKPS
jgi:hypothetical protein